MSGEHVAVAWSIWSGSKRLALRARASGIAASVGWSVVKGSVSAARTGLDVIARACTVMSAATSAAAVLSPLPSSGIVLSTASVITNGIGTTASILSLAAKGVVVLAASTSEIIVPAAVNSVPYVKNKLGKGAKHIVYTVTRVKKLAFAKNSGA